MNARVLLPLMATLSACQPEPRTINWFRAHPEVMREVLADCRAGRPPPRDCANAKEAEASLDAEARLKMFREGFR